MIWKLVYCFSKKLSQNDDKFKNILYSLKKSIEFSSKYHDIKIITDEETLPYLKNYESKIELFTFDRFRFLDDIKIQVLPFLEDNEILIDPDVFLFNKLEVDKKCDLFAERQENIKDEWYVNDFESAKKYKFIKYIKLESKTENVTNIGILKFFNKDLLKKYVDTYNFVRKIAVDEDNLIDILPKYSILFGQLLLQNIIDEDVYNVSYARLNTKNKYYHLAGEQKYNKEYLKSVLERKNIKTTI